MDRVRGAILREAARLGVAPSSLLEMHARAEHLANLGDVISDVEERYELETRELIARIDRRAREWASAGRFTRGPYDVGLGGGEQLVELLGGEADRRAVLEDLGPAHVGARRHHVDTWVRHLSLTPQPTTGRPASPLTPCTRSSSLLPVAAQAGGGRGLAPAPGGRAVVRRVDAVGEVAGTGPRPAARSGARRLAHDRPRAREWVPAVIG